VTAASAVLWLESSHLWTNSEREPMTCRTRAATRWAALEAVAATLGLALLLYALVQRSGFDEL